MEKGLEGLESSLEMLPTYIEADKTIPLNQRIIVLDAGGTNLRVASVYFNRGKKPVIENLKRFPMPGTYGDLSNKEFFQVLAEYLIPLCHIGSGIGFCFSYAMEMMPNKDGRLIRFSKEIRAKEVEGQLIGESLLKALRLKGWRTEKKIVLLNDTVATLLAGKAAFSEKLYDTYIGFILGTGTNTCYIEENKRIKKSSHKDQGKSMIINIESGGYGKAPWGELDREFDQHLNNPGSYVFEKMISGRYLGKLLLFVLKKAVEEEMFSLDFGKKINQLTDLETKNIHEYLAYPLSLQNPLGNCLSTETDRDTLYWIIDGLLERAAILVAINIAAVIQKTGMGTNPSRPVCITAEGTTFLSFLDLRNKINDYLKKHLSDEKDIYFEFVTVDHATLIGSAIAGLTN